MFVIFSPTSVRMFLALSHSSCSLILSFPSLVALCLKSFVVHDFTHIAPLQHIHNPQSPSHYCWRMFLYFVSIWYLLIAFILLAASNIAAKSNRAQKETRRRWLSKWHDYNRWHDIQFSVQNWFHKSSRFRLLTNVLFSFALHFSTACVCVYLYRCMFLMWWSNIQISEINGNLDIHHA